MDNPDNKIIKPAPLWKIWWFFFFYTAGISLLIQFFILPFLFPRWHYGHGLLFSSVDSISFHHWGDFFAQKIRAEGWSAWQLKLHDQFPIGIIAAIYALTVSEPWTLIPMNAAMHASSAIILLRIIQTFIPDWRKAIWCVVPFMFYPSAANWYAQILKDGYFIFGFLSILFGWVLMLRVNNLLESVKITLFFVLGCLFIMISRYYVLELVLILSVCICAVLIIRYLVLLICKNITIKKLIGVLLLQFFVINTITYFVKANVHKDGTITVSKVDQTYQAPAPQAIEAQQEIKTKEEKPVVTRYRELWYKSPWLASKIDYALFYLSGLRSGFLYTAPDAKSNIDFSKGFQNAGQVLRYLPRAMQIVLFAPFPRHWISQGSYESTTFMRKITIFEMLVIYFSLIFLPYALFIWRKRIEIWIILIFNFNLMMLYGLIIPNLGTLYRLRYVFIMTLVGLGLAGFIKFSERFKLGQFLYSSLRFILKKE